MLFAGLETIVLMKPKGKRNGEVRVELDEGAI